MICPKCFHTKTAIYNSRKHKLQPTTWRRHRCAACNFQFTTTERCDPSILTVRYTDKSSQPFNFPTLFLSIAEVCRHRATQNDAYYLSETISDQLLQHHTALIISRDLICQTALQVLENYDTKAYLTYLATHGHIKSRQDIKAALKKSRTKS